MFHVMLHVMFHDTSSENGICRGNIQPAIDKEVADDLRFLREQGTLSKKMVYQGVSGEAEST
jgi:hypothetical protein